MLVGSGGREHALAWALTRSLDCSALFCAPGNAGTASLGTNLPLQVADISALHAACVSHRIDLVVVGPEIPLAAGLVDALQAHDIRVFGPTRAAAELESSKWFAKSLMRQTGVPHADGRAFQDRAEAHHYLNQIAANPSQDVTIRAPVAGASAEALPPVLKADGLAAGKGVIVPTTIDEAHAAVDDLLGGRFGEASATVVIEQQLRGLEASAMAFVDGRTVASMPLSCDYKRALDGDQGPNSGGMGVYSPPGFIPSDLARGIVATIHQPIVDAMAADGRPFAGILYAGLMVNDGAATVLEFNGRFGDPETQVVLPQLRTDLLQILNACVDGHLDQQPIDWTGGAAIGLVLASGGYPGAYQTGFPISGLDDVDHDIQLFHAGTGLDDNGQIITTGGRVLTVVAQAPTLAQARQQAYDNAARIHFQGCTYRTDIALRELA